MIIVGALATLYSFLYCSGSLSDLARCLNSRGTSVFSAAEGYYDATLYTDIQSFNTMLMYFGIIIILLGVLLYVTACNNRRNYYISNYVAIGVCAGGDIVLSFIAIIMNGMWRSKFMHVDFASWSQYVEGHQRLGLPYSESTIWFDLGFIVYGLVIVASIILILNLIWKIKLMQGEKKLLEGGQKTEEVAA